MTSRRGIRGMQWVLRARRRFLRGCVVLAPAFLLGPVATVRARSAASVPARARGQTRISVRDKGAKGDGAADDTAAFQAAIDALPESGGTVAVPAGTYLIDAVLSVRLRSRMRLEMASGAKLVAKPNNSPRAYVLYAFKVSDVEISGGQIQGDRARHLGTEGEWGHGIQIRGASRITVRDMHIAECWGDGICIGGADTRQATPSVDIFIANVRCLGNRRQGLSIGRSRNVRVYDSEFSNTAGTAPQCGIDIEPDRPGGTSGVHIENCIIRNNQGAGIQVYRRVDDVTITRCTIEGNRGHGIVVITARDGLISGNRIAGNGLAGVALLQQSSEFVVRDNRFRGNGIRRRDGKGAGKAEQHNAFAVHVADDVQEAQVEANVIEDR